MRIIFDDNSYLEFLPNKDTMTLILCGKKSYKDITLSKVNLSPEQVSEIIKCLDEWKK